MNMSNDVRHDGCVEIEDMRLLATFGASCSAVSVESHLQMEGLDGTTIRAPLHVSESTNMRAVRLSCSSDSKKAQNSVKTSLARPPVAVSPTSWMDDSCDDDDDDEDDLVTNEEDVDAIDDLPQIETRINPVLFDSSLFCAFSHPNKANSETCFPPSDRAQDPRRTNPFEAATAASPPGGHGNGRDQPATSCLNDSHHFDPQNLLHSLTLVIRNSPTSAAGCARETFDKDNNIGMQLVSGSVSTHRTAIVISPDNETERNGGKQIQPVPSHGHTCSTYFNISSMLSFFAISDPMTWLYLSIFAIFGFTLRVYFARIFGVDCEYPHAVHDVISPLSLCVTATGKTQQTGGALFVDLPANMLGSFIMGTMTARSDDWPTIPWLKFDHPLQSRTDIHLAIRTGFCGSLTTFSSWNSQMVLMIDGYGTVLGRQLMPALFGYVIGLQCAVASFIFGRHVAGWLHAWRNPHLFFNTHNPARVPRTKGRTRCSGSRDTETGGDAANANISGTQPLTEMTVISQSGFESEEDRTLEQTRCSKIRASFPVNTCTTSFILVGALLVLFFVGDFSLNIPFYRGMWIAALFSPPGALLRWKLSWYNGKMFQNSSRWKWIPWGTLAANVAGSILSIITIAIQTRLSGHGDYDSWIFLLLDGLKTGLAGSLSTVSTYAKEIVEITNKSQGGAKGYLYAVGSLSLCGALSLCLYSPIVRLK